MWVIRQRFERKHLSTGQVTVICQDWSETKHSFWVDAQKELMDGPWDEIGYQRRGEILFRPWDSRPVCGIVTRDWLYLGLSRPRREFRKS